MNPVPNPLRYSGSDVSVAPGWVWLPGMSDKEAEWLNKPVANAVCAMACTSYLIRKAGQSLRNLNRNRDTYTRRMRDWLNEADSATDAYLRRMALCLAADAATPEDGPGKALEWAAYFHRDIV